MWSRPFLVRLRLSQSPAFLRRTIQTTVESRECPEFSTSCALPVCPTLHESACGRGSADPKSVTPKQRASEFFDEKLTVSNGQLFCLACREELSLKRCVISCHIKSNKHAEGKEKLKVKEAGEQDIAVALQKMEDEHLKGETLPTDQRVFRVKVVCTLLRAGVPLNKLDLF